VDRRAVSVRRLEQSFFERGLIGSDHLLLNRERLALAAAASPRPGVPLHAHAAKPVALELVGDEIQAWPAVSHLRVGRDARTLLRGRELRLPREPLARARTCADACWTRPTACPRLGSSSTSSSRTGWPASTASRASAISRLVRSS